MSKKSYKSAGKINNSSMSMPSAKRRIGMPKSKTFWDSLAKQDPFKGVPKNKWYVVDGKV